MKKPPQDHTTAHASRSSYTFEPIAIARSPYRERFGAPHQAAAVRGARAQTDAPGSIELLSHVPTDALLHLDGFDYVWAIYVFHLNRGYRATVKPPRTPDVAHGVLATRAPHRPNAIGLSALKLERVEGRVLFVRGIDLLDGTPVLDLKPYLPYADAFPEARAGWVDAAGGSPDHERNDGEPWDT